MLKHICLLGFMGAGKSTIGKALANRIGVAWVDSDLWIQEKQGRTITEIVGTSGWPAFRMLEREFIQEIDDQVPMIISCGGGFPLDKENGQWISSNCTSIYLRVDQKVLLKRLIAETSNRPLLQDKSHSELMQFIDQELRARESIYSKADWVVDANGTIEETLLRIKKLI